MRYLFRALSAVAIFSFLTLGLVLPAGAAEIESADILLIPEGDVFQGDLYAAANRVLIRGTIEGDLLALSAQDIRIEGTVTGSVMTIAAEVVVSGSIGGSLRATSPYIEISGEVGEDVAVVSSGVVVQSGAMVQGDLVAWAWSVETSGSVMGNLEGSIRHLSLGGEIGSDVAVTVASIEVEPDLTVGGDLTYRSDDEIVGLDRSQVGGVVVQQHPVAPNVRLRALGLATRIVVAILLSAVALLVASAWPDRTERALEGISRSPIRYTARGLAVVLSPLVIVGIAVAVFAFAPATAALPLIAALIPVLFATMGLVLVLGFIAGIPAVAWLGSRLRKDVSIAGAVGIGSSIVAVLWLLPLLGWIVAFVAVVVGLGGWISTLDPEPDSREHAQPAES